MKRSITLIIAVLLMAMSFHAKADLYIIGDVEGAGWSANLGVPMTETSANVYEINITINGAFGFASQLGANADDWEGLNANRYGAEYDGYYLTNGIQATLYKNANAYNVINSGTYEVVVDLNAMTVKANSTEPLPECLYLCGAIPECMWDPDKGVKMEQVEEGVYTATATVLGTEGVDGVGSLGYVTFTSQLGADESDWSTFNANRYGPQKYNQVIVPEYYYVLARNEWSFGLSGGEYEVTVDLNIGSASFVPTGVIDYDFPDAIYFIGDIEGAGWATDSGMEVQESEDNPGEYVTEITIAEGGSYFGFVAQLTANAEDWDGLKTYRYVPATGIGAMEEDVMMPVAMNGDISFSIAPGTYTCTVQLTCVGGGWITLTDAHTGVSDVDAEAAARVVAGDGEILIVGDADEVNVYTASGMLIASDVETITCPAGVYIVVIDGRAHKVLVK